MNILHSSKRNLIVAIVVLVTIIIIATVFLLIKSDDNNNSIDVVNVDLSARSRTVFESSIKSDLENAKTPEEKLKALLSSTTIEAENGNLEQAVVFALEAYEIEGLDAVDRFQKAMNLVEIYGKSGQFDKGIEILNEISTDTEAMSLEASEFYTNRYRNAYRDGGFPTPVNCADPQGPEDCPL